MPIPMCTSIQILFLGVVHKLQSLVIQNMLTMGESRDMSRIYISLQGSFRPIDQHCPSPSWTCLTKIALLFPLEIVFLNFNKLLPNLELKEKYHEKEKNNI